MPLPKGLDQLPTAQLEAIQEIRELLLRSIQRHLNAAYTPGETELLIPRGQVRPGDEVVREGVRSVRVRRDWLGLRQEADRAIEAIIASDYNPLVIDSEIEALTGGHYARVRDQLALAIRDASLYADQQADLLDWYKMSSRIRKAKELDKPDLISATERRFWRAPESVMTQDTALTWLRSRPAKVLQRVRTAQDRAAVAAGKHKVPLGGTSGNLNLSRALHGKGFAEGAEVKQAVYRSLAQAQSVDEAGRELVTIAQRAGRPISANAAEWSRRYKRDGQSFLDELERAGLDVSKFEDIQTRAAAEREARKLARKAERLPEFRRGAQLRRDIERQQRIIKEAGRRLANNGGQAAIDDFQAVVRKLEAHAARLVGDKASRKTVSQLVGGYVEAVQDARAWVAKGAPKGGLERVLQKLVYRRQRQHAERIIRTEAHAAYRLRQAEMAERRKWVKFQWMLSGAHAAWKAKQQPKTKRRRAVICVCDRNAGNIYTAAEVKGRWSHGGHPNCMCWFRTIVDRDKMRGAPITGDEDEWLEKYAEELGLD